MLPLLRIVPVGGVFLAIMIVILALNPPGDTRPPLSRAATSARGALASASDHPEWRQFLIHAAVRRADELERLRELPDTPVRMPEVTIEVPVEAPPPAAAEEPPKVAGLPVERTDADPEDLTGSISELPGVTIPIEIGEASSTELPVTPPPDTPPVIRMPEQSKPLNESRSKPVQRIRRAKAVAKPAPPPETPNLFEVFFNSLQGKPQTPSTAEAVRPVTTRKTSPPAAAAPAIRPATVNADRR